MAKVTSASNRSTRKSTQPVRQGQDPYRANRQAVSKATVSNSGQGVTPGSAKVTTGQGKQRVTLPNLPKPKPTVGTTNTIRATGGNSNYSKINQLSAPTAPRPASKPSASANLAKSQQMLRSQVGPVASALSGARSLAINAVADTVGPKPTANQDVAYNQQLVKDVMKKRKRNS